MTLELLDSCFKTVGVSDKGLVRQNNEDDFTILYFDRRNLLLLCVVDGVGGEDGGEIAADLAKTELEEYFTEYPNGEISTLLLQGVCHANNQIFKKRSLLGYPNMSCVLTAVAIHTDSGRAAMCHVGDTRLYHWQDGVVRKVSHDHSLVGYREEIGELTENEAMNHPQRHIISRDIGSSHQMPLDNEYFEVQTFLIKKNDRLLLCSDGLTDLVPIENIDLVMSQAELLTMQKANSLIELANTAGGKDNVTVVVFEAFTPPAPPTEVILNEEIDNVSNESNDIKHAVKPPKKTAYFKTVTIALLVIAVVAVAIFVFLKYFS